MILLWPRFPGKGTVRNMMLVENFSRRQFPVWRQIVDVE
jgi:hypothetical protein